MLQPPLWQRLGHFLPDIVQQPLPDFTAQIERGRGIARRHQPAHLDRVRLHLRHLHVEEPPVPARARLDQFAHLLAQARNVRRRIEIPEDRTQQLAGLARPVLETILQELGDRHDQPPLVPDAYDHEGQVDLLDPPPFIVDDDHVVEADRLGKGHLHARDQVLERGLRGGADDQPCDTRRGHQRDADGADAGHAEQHQADGQEHDQKDADPSQYLCPRPLSPGAEIVLDADISAQIDHALKRAQRGYR